MSQAQPTLKKQYSVYLLAPYPLVQFRGKNIHSHFDCKRVVGGLRSKAQRQPYNTNLVHLHLLSSRITTFPGPSGWGGVVTNSRATFEKTSLRAKKKCRQRCLNRSSCKGTRQYVYWRQYVYRRQYVYWTVLTCIGDHPNLLPIRDGCLGPQLVLWLWPHAFAYQFSKQLAPNRHFFQEPVKESPYHNGCCGLVASSPVFFSCSSDTPKEPIDV